MPTRPAADLAKRSLVENDVMYCERYKVCHPGFSRPSLRSRRSLPMAFDE